MILSFVHRFSEIRHYVEAFLRALQGFVETRKTAVVFRRLWYAKRHHDSHHDPTILLGDHQSILEDPPRVHH